MKYFNIYLQNLDYFHPVVARDVNSKANDSGKYNLKKIYLFSQLERCQEFLNYFKDDLPEEKLGDVDIDAIEKWLNGTSPDVALIKNLEKFNQMMGHHFAEHENPIPQRINESFLQSNASEFVNNVWQIPHLHYVDKVIELQRIEGVASRDAQGWSELLDELNNQKFEDKTFAKLWEKILTDLSSPKSKDYFRLLLDYFHRIAVVDL